LNINTINNFTIPESSHQRQLGSHSFQITNFDLNTLVIVFNINSAIQTITIKKGENLNIDLDGDKINDISFTFVGTYSNRAEITLKSLAPLIGSAAVIVNATDGSIVKVNAPNRPAVYYILNGYRYLFVNRETYTSWSAAAGDSSNKFATLKPITQAEFDVIPIGGNLAVKSGTLIKFDDCPQIYVVGADNK